MTSRVLSICLACSIYDGEHNTCAAFPDGVPDNITLNMFDHRNPYPGDHGIRFQLRNPEILESYQEAYDEAHDEAEPSLLKMAMWDPAKHPRGQPQNAGEFASQQGGTMIAPHLSDPVPTPSGRGGAKENWKATHFHELPQAYQDKILKNVHDGSPNGLTPGMMLENIAHVYDHAMTQHWEVPEGGKDADGAWVPGPDEIALAGIHWYNDAHADADALSAATGIDIDHAVGTIASLSPQTDWDSNIAVANFLGRKLKEDAVVQLDPDEVAYRKRQSKSSKGDAQNVTIPVGKRLSEMSPGEAAWALYAMASSEGLKNGLTSAISGKAKRASLSMGAQNMSKAVRIFRGEDPDKILSGHKVRSFYNNIMDPDNERGMDDVTIDTHAVSAATGYKVTASGRTIKRMFEAGASTPANVKGAYALFADAYRKLAARHGITPNQVQAIVWTHWQTVKGGHHGYREDFPDIVGDIPPKSDHVKRKEAESKARAAARKKKAKEAKP